MPPPLPDPPDELKILALERFGTAETAAAAGVPVNRFAQRIKEGRVPILGPRAPGSGNRRQFQLLDVYLARLQQLAADAGGDLVEASALAKAIVEQTTHGEFTHPAGRWPADWPADWRNRDLSNPVLLAAARYPFGWKVARLGNDDVIAELRRLPQNTDGALPSPDDDIGGPASVRIINLTRELVAVDRVLLACRLESGEGAND